MRMGGSDLICAAASLAALVFVAAAAVVAGALLLSLGSPLLIIGAVLGMGIVGVLVLFGLAVGFITAWYALYMLIRSRFGETSAPERQGSYTICRIRKT